MLNLSKIQSLLDARRPNHTLPQDFYADPDVFAFDLAAIYQQNWILAIEVIAAESATLAVATEKDSAIDLHANAAIPAGIAGVTIAKPTLGWTASSWKGSGYSSVCQPGTPLYHCLKVRKSSKFSHNWQTELLDAANPADMFTHDPLDPLLS